MPNYIWERFREATERAALTSSHSARRPDASFCERESRHAIVNGSERHVSAAMVDLAVNLVDLDRIRAGISVYYEVRPADN
jgi:hypothetical protein